METQEFVKMVREMRDAQKEYFRTRSRDSLVRSKELERKVDDCLSYTGETLFNGDMI